MASHKFISIWMPNNFISTYLLIPNTIIVFHLFIFFFNCLSSWRSSTSSSILRSGIQAHYCSGCSFLENCLVCPSSGFNFFRLESNVSACPLTKTVKSPWVLYFPTMSLPQILHVFLYTPQVIWFDTKTRTYFVSFLVIPSYWTSVRF